MFDNEDLQEISFDDIGRKIVPANIGGERMFLVEADGEVTRKWKNAQLKTTQLEDGKISSFGNVADTEALLVSLCLFRGDENGQLRVDEYDRPDTRFRVAEAIIRSWPHRVQNELFERTKRISGLEEKETVASIQKQISSLQKKLKELVREEEKEREGAEDPTRD